MQEVMIRRISVGTVFKLVGVGLLFSLLPFTILMGCTAALGLNTLSWNNEPLHGWVALVASPFIGVFLVVLFTMFLGTTTAFGLWVYSWLGPFGISFKPAEQDIGPATHPADAA